MIHKKGLVFPFTFIPNHVLERVLTHWERIVLFLPHGLEPQAGLDRYLDSGRISLKRPSKDLMPPDSFPYLLREYKTWISTNLDKSYVDFLRYAKPAPYEEDSIYGIRGVLRKGLQKEISPQELSLKWHLILHLFHETLLKMYEAQKFILEAKSTEPIFKEAVFDEEILDHPLDDLTSMDIREYFDQQQLEDVIEAWLGLFGAYLVAQEELITWHEEIIQVLIGDIPVTYMYTEEGFTQYTLPNEGTLYPKHVNVLKGKNIYLIG